MVTCPACGERNPVRARFCLNCATPLVSSGAGDERKVVTVLFCDLVGFTGQSELTDPEDVRATLRRYHDRIRSAIESYSGTVEKFIGDAVMAVFGAPSAHEDDPERAVHAALRILSAIEDLNEEDPTQVLAVRIGVNTGEVLVARGALPGSGEAMVAGDVVNTAARLQGVAAVGAIAVGEKTFRATSDLFVYESLGSFEVKGKSLPVPAWHAIAARSRQGTEPHRRFASPMIGRERELAELRDAFHAVVTDRSVRMVAVIGEAGVGKSRLIAEFFAELEARPDIVTWRQGRCLPYGEGITFWALGEIVKAEAGILESDGPDEASAKLAASLEVLIEEPAERSWLRARLAPLLGLEFTSSADRDEAFTAWGRFLAAIATPRPMVAVIDDIHWADEAMIAFLRHLVVEGIRVPLLVVTTARPELFDRYPGWDRGPPGLSVVALQPLSAEEAALLLSSLMSRAALPAETQAMILERTGGNPLFTEEFVRVLGERGLIDAAGRLSADPTQLPHPESVQALITARLDALPQAGKALLQDAAVIGNVFWSGALAAMSGLDEARVRTGLVGLADREMVRPARVSTVRDQAEYVFSHGLVRDVAYGEIPRAARSAKHRAAARWIEGVAGERVTGQAEVLVHHATKALEFARASRELDSVPGLEDDCRRYLLMAGERALALDAARAGAHLRAALELSPPGHPERPHVVARLAEALHQAGSMAEAERLYEEAIDDLEASGSNVQAAEALTGLALVVQYRGNPAGGRSFLAKAIGILEAADAPAGVELLRALTIQAGSYTMSGNYGEALARADQALRLAEVVDDPEARTRALGIRGVSRLWLGDQSGLDDQRAALDAALELGMGKVTGMLYSNLAFDLTMVRAEESVKVFREGIAFADDRGLSWLAGAMRTNVLFALVDLGRFDEVLRASAEALEELRGQGAGYSEVMGEAARAAALLHRGRRPEASAVAERILPRAREIGDPQVLLRALLPAAVSRMAAGDQAGSVALLEEALEVTWEAGAGERAHLLPSLVRAAVAARTPGLAERITEGLEEWPLPRIRCGFLTARAELREAEGGFVEAAALHALAGTGWEEVGSALEVRHALLGEGRCLVLQGDARSGSVRLREARGFLVELGSDLLIAEADAWLRVAAERSS